MERRTDYKTALLIDAVIHEAAEHGSAAAARELVGLGVQFEVAVRVLTQPAKRRSQLPPRNPLSTS
jgi:hypothetical protein